MATKLRIYEVCVINISCDCIPMLCSIYNLTKLTKGTLGSACWFAHTRHAPSHFPQSPSTTLCFTIISRWTIYQASVYVQWCKLAIRQEGNSRPPRPGTCPAHFGQGVHEAIFCPFLLSTLEWFKRALSPVQIRFTTTGWNKPGAPTLQRV